MNVYLRKRITRNGKKGCMETFMQLPILNVNSNDDNENNDDSKNTTTTTTTNSNGNNNGNDNNFCQIAFTALVRQQ